MKILTICPSNRPNKLSKMLDSFRETSSSSEILINGEDKSITEIFNQAFQRNPDYDFYHMTNDDVIYKTKGWDLKLANKGKISWGKDSIQDEGLCTFPMIDGDIVRALGWLQLPTLSRYCGDLVWKFIGKECKILNYMPDVITEHEWNGCTHPSDNARDTSEFSKWLPWAFKDVARVRKVLNNDSNI